jgi:hypothetical protein
MAAVPLLEEMSGSPSGAMIAELTGLAPGMAGEAHVELLQGNRPLRRLAIYPASAGFELVEELDHLCARTIEPNVFFNPRFLAPAMPRLEDREVRLAVIRDGDEERSRLRLLVPFSVDRPAIPLGVSIIRTWSSPFGPLGTPLVDRDDPAGVIEDFFAMLGRPHLKLPKVLVLPEVRLDGPVASLLGAVAESRGLTLVTINEVMRPFLESKLDGDAYLKNSFVEVPYFSLLVLPDFFQCFMAVVVFTPIELPDTFEEFQRWFFPAVVLHFCPSTRSMGEAKQNPSFPESVNRKISPANSPANNFVTRAQEEKNKCGFAKDTP